MIKFEVIDVKEQLNELKVDVKKLNKIFMCLVLCSRKLLFGYFDFVKLIFFKVN